MHDRKGRPLSVGDKVVIPGTIMSTSPGGDPAYCNITVQCDEPMGKGTAGEYSYSLTLNAGQVEKIVAKIVQ